MKGCCRMPCPSRWDGTVNRRRRDGDTLGGLTDERQVKSKINASVLTDSRKTVIRVLISQREPS